MRRYALVTGASSGIGYETCNELVRRGWFVFATMRRAGEREALYAAHGENVRVLSLDVTKPKDIAPAVEAVRVQTGGQLHLLVNNAGFGMFGPLETADEKEVLEQFEVNVFGLLRVTRAFLPLLRDTKGTIVNISSILGRCSAANTGLYAATKFAVEALTESLHYELHASGVKAFAVEPGLFKTNFGDNCRWTKASYDPSSSYFERCELHRARLASFRSTAFGNPGSVARLIARVAEGRAWGMSSTVGYDAWAVNTLRALLPRGLFTGITAFIYDRLFLRKVSPPE